MNKTKFLKLKRCEFLEFLLDLLHLVLHDFEFYSGFQSAYL